MGSVPQIGANILYASQNGCVPDCVVATGLKVGGGSPTDNTAALNALLVYAGSFAGGARLVLDGGFAHKGLLIPSNVSLEGTGPASGLFLLAGSDTHCITNWTSSGQAAMQNIAVKNMTINGNYPNNGATGSFECGIFLYNVAGIVIDSVVIINSTYFNTLFETCSNVQVVAPNFSSNWLNGDGVHFCGGGGCSNIKVSRHTISTIDDGIALNAPEHPVGPSTGGPISDVEISDGVYIGALSMVRMYSSASGGATVTRVMVTNCSGTFTGQAWASGCVFFLGNGDTLADGIQNFSANNITAILTDSSGNFVKINDSCGKVRIANSLWDSPVAANVFVLIQTAAVTVSDLELVNCTIYRSTRGSSLAYGVQSTIAGAVIGRLRIDGFNIVNQSGQSYGAIPYLIDMANLSITELVIDALDPTFITALVNPVTGFTGITTVRGAGVLASGFAIPDSIMANDTPYISATTNLPSIKIGGVVKTLDPLVGTLTTTAATSDAVTIAGVTSASVVVLTATNAVAGAMTGIYATPTSNTVTVTHPVTPGGTFSILVFN